MTSAYDRWRTYHPSEDYIEDPKDDTIDELMKEIDRLKVKIASLEYEIKRYQGWEQV